MECNRDGVLKVKVSEANSEGEVMVLCNCKLRGDFQMPMHVESDSLTLTMPGSETVKAISTDAVDEDTEVLLDRIAKMDKAHELHNLCEDWGVQHDKRTSKATMRARLADHLVKKAAGDKKKGDLNK